MDYVEIHPSDTGGAHIRIYRGGLLAENVYLSSTALLGQFLVELGVGTTGPWQELTDENGATYSRAVIVS